MTQKNTHTTEELTPNLVGRKSEQTRRRIIDATKKLIAQGNYTYTTKITDIARAANIAQPHFYIYFSSVEDVVFAIAEEIYAKSTSVGGFNIPSDADWSGKQGFLLLRSAVEAGFARWRENYAIHTIGLLLADKEEGRFRELRVRRYQFLSQIFVDKIRDSQRKGRLSANINPMLRGQQCVNILMNMAQQYDVLITSGFLDEQIVDETTYLLLSAVGLPTNLEVC